MGTYVVQKGDTLSGIGERLFGDPEFWRSEEFRAANPGIKNVNRIGVGQVINIPGYEPEEQAIPLPRPRPTPHKPTSGIDSVPPGVGSNRAAMEAARQDGSAGAAYVTGAPGVMARNYPAGAGGARPDPTRRPVQRQLAIGPFPSREEHPGALPAAKPNDPSLMIATQGAFFGHKFPPPNISARAQALLARTKRQQNPSGAMTEAPEQAPSAAGLLQRGVEKAIPTEEPHFENADPGPQLTLTPEQLDRLSPDDRSTLARILSNILPEQNLLTDIGWLDTSAGN